MLCFVADVGSLQPVSNALSVFVIGGASLLMGSIGICSTAAAAARACKTN